MGTERDRGSEPDPAKTSDRKHVEDILDEALEESFPASDPASPTRPHEAKD
jgi:hypothetical protein